MNESGTYTVGVLHEAAVSGGDPRYDYEIATDQYTYTKPSEELNASTVWWDEDGRINWSVIKDSYAYQYSFVLYRDGVRVIGGYADNDYVEYVDNAPADKGDGTSSNSWSPSTEEDKARYSYKGSQPISFTASNAGDYKVVQVMGDVQGQKFFWYITCYVNSNKIIIIVSLMGCKYRHKVVISYYTGKK